MNMNEIIKITDLTKSFGNIIACSSITLEVYPGEIVGIVGESGSGKTTLLKCASGLYKPDSGEVIFRSDDNYVQNICNISEPDLRQLMRTDWSFIHQNPRDGLRMNISAGGNIGEKLMAIGNRHYGNIREAAAAWLEKVEIDSSRIDELPSNFSGGMQQRLQIARCLITEPKLIYMDEPTGGLDVSVQAKILDLIKKLVEELNIAAVIVTHDLGVVRLLADRVLVMKDGHIVEQGITDQVLDDPHHAYTQLLVSSIIQV